MFAHKLLRKIQERVREREAELIGGNWLQDPLH